MLAAVLHGPGQLRVEPAPTPEPGPGELLVRVEACGICLSDLRLWRRGHSDLLTLPAVIGHEAAGVVVAAPGRDDGLVGRRIFVDGYGGFAEYTLVDAAALARQGGPFLLPDDGLPWDEAVFVEPLADCLYAVEHCADPGTATSALVAGCGQMGLQIVQLLALRGLSVLASDPLPQRRALARAYGAQPLDPGDADVVAAARAASGGPGCDIAVVACPSVDAVRTALAALAPGGVCVLFSTLPDGPVPIDLAEIHRRRLRLVGSRWVLGRRTPRYELYRQAIRLLADRRVDVRPLVDARVGFDGLLDSFDAMAGHRILKAVLYPGGPVRSA